MLIQSHLSPDLFGMYYAKFGSTTIYEMKKSAVSCLVYVYIYILYMLCIFTWVSLKCNEEV